MANGEEPVVRPQTEPLTLQMQPLQIKWYPISEDKLDNLAFAGNTNFINASKMAILLASVCAGALGFLWLRVFSRAATDEAVVA